MKVEHLRNDRQKIRRIGVIIIYLQVKNVFKMSIERRFQSWSTNVSKNNYFFQLLTQYTVYILF